MKNTNKFETTKRMECSADTKLFFDDVYKLGTREKKQQVETIQSERSILSKCARYTQYFLSDVYINSTRTKKAQVETVQCGRSMIEMLGVLAIVGVLSVGGIAGYSKAMMKFKINKTADQISQIVTNIRTLYAQQTTYQGLNTVSAYNMGVIPDEMGSYHNIGWTDAINNPFSGPVMISTHSRLSSSSNDAFVIEIGGLPIEACVTLATMDWGSSYSSGLIAVGVGSAGAAGKLQESYLDSCTSYTSSDGNGSSSCSKDGPLPVATAASICSYYGTSDTDRYVRLKFY